jgi:hypothetical protein
MKCTSWVVTLLGVGMLVVLGCGKSEPVADAGSDASGSDVAADGGGEPVAAPAPAEIPDEMKLASVDFAKQFADDAEAATAKFEEKWVQLTGSLTTQPGQGGITDSLSIAGYKKEGGIIPTGVVCRLAPGEYEKVKDLSVSQEITFKGQVLGASGGSVYVENSEVTEIGPDPAIEIDAVELSQAFAADEAAAKEKFTNKPVKVTGEVAALNEDDFTIDLKGAQTEDGAPILVKVAVGTGFNDLKDKVAVGETISAKGVVSVFSDNELSIMMSNVLGK